MKESCCTLTVSFRVKRPRICRCVWLPIHSAPFQSLACIGPTPNDEIAFSDWLPSVETHRTITWNSAFASSVLLQTMPGRGWCCQSAATPLVGVSTGHRRGRQQTDT